MTPLLILISLLVAVVVVQRFFRVWWFRRQYFPVQQGLADADCVWPVDGTVVYVKNVDGVRLEAEKQGRKETVYEFPYEAKGLVIGIYMSPFDRHSIVAPRGGWSRVIGYQSSGRNLPMLDLWEYVRFFYFGRLVEWGEKKLFGFVAQNEKVVIHTAPFILVGIADRFVDKIDVFSDGEEVGRGQPIAHIRRGSQTDIFIPHAVVESLTPPEIGQRVWAGTLMLTLKEEWLKSHLEALQ